MATIQRPQEFPNQSLLPTERNYPLRTVLSDDQTSWDLELPKYMPEIAPDPSTVLDRLESVGILKPNKNMLRVIGSLSTRQISEIYGEGIVKIRHPLGRTGINGSGIFGTPGESRTADIGVLREDHAGLQIALVFNRNRWGLPGGFCDNHQEINNLKLTALREAHEEIGLDLTDLTDSLVTVKSLHVKPRSKRSTDLAYISTQVEALLISESDFDTTLQAGDDAEFAAWFTLHEIDTLTISADHREYVRAIFEHFNSN